MGVEKAILLKDDSVRDSYSVARALAEELKRLAPDCILFGKQSIDYSDEQIPGIIGEILGIPSVSVIVKFEIKDNRIICEREIEGGREIVEATLPVILTAQKGLNEPRYPSLKGIMSAKTKPIEERPAAPFARAIEVISMQKPPAKPAGRIVGTDATAVAELVRLLHEEAKVI